MQIGVYKMKKILAILLIVISLSTLLISCDKSGESVPEGLQIVKISEEGGYKFYGPEHWSIINTNDVAATKVSPVNNTSMTFTEAAVPVGTIPEYFEDSLSQFPESIKSTMTITLRDEKCTFGNAKEAYKYIYTYKYEDYDFACMQILLTHDDRFFIFTYTSYGDINDSESAYNLYLDKVQQSIDAFLFTERKEKSPVSYEKDADGYNLVSDRVLAGFDLYIPSDYEVVYSSGYVKAKISDGANISLSKATQTGISIVDYLKNRKSELQRFVSDFTDVKIAFATEFNIESEVFKNWAFDVMAEHDSSISFGNLKKNAIAAYEYTYVFDGKTYCVYQVMGVDSFNGYVFTYTALESEYSTHIDEIKTILTKVNF